MKKAIIAQTLIFVLAWVLMTPDQLADNTYVFGLIGSVEVIKGNTDWVMLGAMILSVLNLWFWWPKEVRKNTTPSESSTPVVAEAKAEEAKDPVVPKMD